VGTNEQRAKEYAYKLLSYRSRSIKEIRDRLSLRGYKADTIESVIRSLVDSGYLNDTSFAREWIKSKLSCKPVGITALKVGLLQKGLDKEVVSGLLAELDEYAPARRLAEKKLASVRKANQDVRSLRRRLYSYLVSRGFSHETVYRVVKEFLKNDE
jgi:regulatory protein